jgi:hypothetical protein
MKSPGSAVAARFRVSPVDSFLLFLLFFFLVFSLAGRSRF